MTASTQDTKAAIGIYITGRNSIEPEFAGLASKYEGWQGLAQKMLADKFSEFLGLLTIEQLANVAAGRVDIAAIACSTTNPAG
ncbi:MAG: hypothetical protein ACK5NE_09385 [Brachymonas sp.]